MLNFEWEKNYRKTGKKRVAWHRSGQINDCKYHK